MKKRNKVVLIFCIIFYFLYELLFEVILGFGVKDIWEDLMGKVGKKK